MMHEILTKSQWVQRQFARAVSGFVPLRNGKIIPVRFAFRCLYCGEFFGQKEAEEHFGQTREEYNRARDFDVMTTKVNIFPENSHSGELSDL